MTLSPTDGMHLEMLAPGASSKPVRALLLAEMCNPNWSSVPLVAWNLCDALSKVADVHLVTHKRNRADILQHGWIEGRDFTVFDSGEMETPIFRALNFLGLSIQHNQGLSALTAATALVYRQFENAVCKAFGDRISQGAFDIVHRVSPLSPAVPSIIAGPCRQACVPFILGPINGGLPWPPYFPELRSREKDWPSLLRPLHKLLPGYHRTRRDAAAIIVGSCAAAKELPLAYKDKTFYIPENGVDIERFEARDRGPARNPLKIVFVGRLVPLKCVDVVLKAAAPLVRAHRAEVLIIGDGPEMMSLRALARTLGISDHVEFAGWVPQSELPDRLRDGDVFAFPSVREFGGAVVIEAMAMGLVPVVVDYGGPTEFVTPESGFAIPLTDRDGLVRGFSSAFEDLERNRDTLQHLGNQARARIVDNFTWSQKARQVMDVYGWALGLAPRPHLEMPFP